MLTQECILNGVKLKVELQYDLLLGAQGCFQVAAQLLALPSFKWKKKKKRDKARHLQGKLLVINPPGSTSLIESKKL